MAKKPKVRKLVYEDAVLDLLRERRKRLAKEERRYSKLRAYLDAEDCANRIDLIEDLLWDIGCGALEGPND